MKAKVNAEILSRMLPFVAKGDIRYYLNGVYLEPHHSGKGALLVATDGHVMMVGYDETGECDEPQIREISKPLISEIKKAKNADEQVKFYDDQISFMGLHASNSPIDGKYPDWRRVCGPVQDQGSRQACFNPELFKRFYDAGFRYGMKTGKDNPLILTLGGVGESSRITIAGDNRFFAVIMPIRIGEKEGPKPGTNAVWWMH